VRKCGKLKQPSQHQICRQYIRYRKLIWENHMWCHDNISEVVTLASMTPNFWCSLEVVAVELYLCFVIKGNLWWKRTFLPMVTIVVLHYKYIKLFKLSTPHVIVWFARKGFNQSIGRTKGQKARLQCLACEMPKSVISSRVIKNAKLLRRKSAEIWQC